MKNILGLGDVKYTVNTPTVIAILVNRANNKTPIALDDMHEQQLLLSMADVD
jgi:hypothetical protein